jgi:opacity protein-like surface antigen
MMNIRHLLRAFVGIAILIPSIGAAQSTERGPGWDYGLDVIYQFSHDVSFQGGSTLSLDDDLGLGLNFGYRLNPRFEVNFTLDWNSFDYRGTLQSADNPGLSADVSGDMEWFVPRVNGSFNFLKGPLTPYVSAGIGWAFIDTNIPTGQVSVGCWWDPWYGQICTPYQPTLSTDELTYQAGAGLRWDAGENFSARLSYEKTWLDLSNTQSAPGLDQLKIGLLYRY